MRWLIVTLIALAQAAAPAFPKAELATSSIRATVTLPDVKAGYYQGTRFDWSGSILSLKWGGHEYFGQWFEKYDPKIHDAITGPVEEFLTDDAGLGYAEAKPGEVFVRIGVGAVRKPAEPAYRRFETYEVVDHGKWSTKTSHDRIDFTHHLGEANGYGYLYRKTLRLSGNTLVIEHRLENTGRKPIVTSVYDHNFFTLDGQTTGPDAVVQFTSFDPKAARPLNGLAETRGREIRFLKPFEAKETVFTEVSGFGSTARDYDFRIENRKTGAGVHVTSDQPLAKLLFWSAWKTVCPEPYIDMRIEPGKAFTWTITYEFYQAAKAPAAAPADAPFLTETR
ncbi:MAG: hypothetical protein ABIX28_00885 [Vicinamibacterales bacterium]